MKTIFLTFTATITVVALAATLFLNTILATFGLVSTSVETLHHLKSSQTVIEKMKVRHQTKTQNLTKRLTKRSSRRVAAASLAAATVGTAAVAITMTGFEIQDYCEQQASLHTEHSILYSTMDEFDYNACLEQSKVDSVRILTEVKQSANESVAEAMDFATDYSHDKWLAIKDAYMISIESAAQTINEVRGSFNQ